MYQVLGHLWHIFMFWDGKIQFATLILPVDEGFSVFVPSVGKFLYPFSLPPLANSRYPRKKKLLAKL